MKIAFFDFDGTITTKDTFIQFLRFIAGPYRFYFGLFFKLPLILSYKLGLMPNWKAKESVFSFFVKGKSEKEMKEKGVAFSKNILPKIMRQEALETIEFHKNNGSEIVVVTASFSLWVSPWCKDHNLGVLSTKYEVKGDTLTGRIKGENCYGKEKVNRIKEDYNLEDYDEIYAYGDSQSDWDMLNLATKKWMKWKPLK